MQFSAIAKTHRVCPLPQNEKVDNKAIVISC